jgi:hypothetical protein
MIETGVIAWIVQTLQTELNTIGDYSLEYSTALLMNLSLRREGKTKCCELPILQALNELLEHDNLQVRTHVNGTLYSVLQKNSLRQKAFELGMREMLEVLIQNSDEQFQRQI